jgi:uncharacterized protein (DUF427 family)
MARTRLKTGGGILSFIAGPFFTAGCKQPRTGLLTASKFIVQWSWTVYAMNKDATATESVWDYPRPPRLEATPRRIRILHPDYTIADSSSALRVLETSHPPVFYLPPQQVDMRLLRWSESPGTYCEFKGVASYWHLEIPRPGHAPLVIPDAAWSYETPTRRYAAMAGHLAFYASRLAEGGIDCMVDDERVLPQPGDFYGGWITSNLRGPFKGAPGTRHW